MYYGAGRPTKSHEYIFLLTKSARYFYDAEAIRTPAKQSSIDRLSQPTLALQEGSHRANGGGKTNGTMKAVGRIDKQQAMGANARTVWEIATAGYKEAHFATFPPEIPRRCILAGTSAKGQCPTCGAPWRRVVERESYGKEGWGPTKKDPHGAIGNSQSMARDGNGAAGFVAVTTIGWEPTCACDAGDPVPQTVLDPFAGSGTTGVVALRHGRSFVGIDLNAEYVAMARNRITQDAPLFNRVSVA